MGGIESMVEDSKEDGGFFVEDFFGVVVERIEDVDVGKNVFDVDWNGYVGNCVRWGG